MKRISLVFLLIGIIHLSFSQNYTLSGTVKDATTNETIPQATISIPEADKKFLADFDGNFSVTLPKGTYTVNVDFIGFKTYTQSVELNKNQSLTVSMGEDINVLNEVVITAERADQHVKEVQMSTEKLDMEEIKKLPSVFGEPDLVKSIQLLPGVTSVGEGASGFNVRGGAADQNLIFWNGAPVYMTSHFFGFFSVFNSDVVNDLTLYKGGVPAKYGGRLSSILEVSQRKSDFSKLNFSGGIGMVTAKGTVTAPIKKDKSAFIVSARRSLFGYLMKLGPPDVSSNNVYFYDLNVGLDFNLNEKNKLSFSSYYGKDVWKSGDQFKFDWGNFVNSLNLKHTYNDSTFSNTHLAYTRYDYGFGLVNAFNSNSVVENIILGHEITKIKTNHRFNYGFSSNYYILSPGGFKPEGDFKNIFTERVAYKEKAFENSLFVSDEIKVSPKFTVQAGLRYNIYTMMGSKTVYKYQDGVTKSEDAIVDSSVYKNGQPVKTFHGFEPRLALNYGLDSTSSIKFSYQRMRQNIFLISNTSSGLPIDRWKLSDPNLAPQIADQIAMGYFRNFRKNMYEGSVEVYYKWMKNQVDYKNGAQIFFFSDELNRIETQLLQGPGRAYGAEFMLRKKQGRLTGWISYTLSKTERQIKNSNIKEDNINRGKWYPSAYDKPHNLSLVASYQLSKRLTFSGNFVYSSGRPQSFPDGKYEINGSVISNYSSRNAYRIPDYHRLDLSLRLENKKNFNRRFKSYWQFAVYNVYARRNAYSYIFSTNETDQTSTEVSRLSLLGTIIPTLSYEFKF